MREVTTSDRVGRLRRLHRSRLGLALLGALLLASSCDPPTTREKTDPPVPRQGDVVDAGADDGGGGDETDGGTDGGDAGDGGDDDGGEEAPPDGGAPDGGGDAGAILEGPGPWPTEALTNLSATFGVGEPQSIGLDEAMNLWLLSGDRIGILRPGDTAPTWTHGVGQAASGFGPGKLANGSTVICGGAPGRAYVGYYTYELSPARIAGPLDADYDPVRFLEYQKGDLDAVRVGEDGTVSLEEHVHRSIGTSGGKAIIGIRNTNDYHYDEDRSVLRCQRVVRGRDRGDLYIGTNHGVTRIRGLEYNSHRHITWNVAGSMRAGLNYGLGLAPNGDVLIANDWMLGIIRPSPELREWDEERTWEGTTPWVFRGHNQDLSSLEDFDFWRGFQQTTDGRYFLGSSEFGLWELVIQNRSTGSYHPVGGLPTNRISALQATDDGALYIATDGAGLWRRDPDGSVAQVEDVAGRRVRELLYEPNLTPTMLLVLTDDGVFLLRGP